MARVKPTQLSSKLLHAIMTVESGGNVNAVSGDGKSIGPYQIQEPYYNAAVQFDSGLSAQGAKWQNCKGKDSVSYSERVMQVRSSLLVSSGTK